MSEKWVFIPGRDNKQADIENGEPILGTIMKDGEGGWHVARIWSDAPNAEANALKIAAVPTMAQKLADTVEWLEREVNNRQETIDTLNQGEVVLTIIISKDLTHQINRLQKLRDDLAETLKKIELYP